MFFFFFLFIATKPGRCPVVSNSTRCEQECESDADCSRDWKCCSNGCGTSCLEPAPEQPVHTPQPQAYNVTVRHYGTAPAVIIPPEEPHVTGEEGGYVSMKCIATGDPKPVITWKKDALVVRIISINSKKSQIKSFTQLIYYIQ